MVLRSIFQPVFTLISVVGRLIRDIPKIFEALIRILLYFINNFVPLFVGGIKLAGIIIQNLFHYITHPLEFFQFLIQLGLFVVTMIVSIAYNIPISKNYKFGDFITYIINFIIVQIVFINALAYWLVVKFLFEYILLRNVDKLLAGFITSFYYRYFLSLENPPDAWYNTPNYHLGNKNMKLLFAFNSCPRGFIPNGIFCERNNNHIPNFCTSSNIYKKYSDIKESNRGFQFPKTFNQSNSTFLKMSKNEKLKHLNKYTAAINEYHSSCETLNRNKSTLTKTICRSNNEDIKNLCKYSYCKHSNDPFCHYHKDTKNNYNQESDNRLIVVFYILLILAIGAVACLRLIIKK